MAADSAHILQSDNAAHVSAVRRILATSHHDASAMCVVAYLLQDKQLIAFAGSQNVFLLTITFWFSSAFYLCFIRS
jgi:hypothetical protein